MTEPTPQPHPHGWHWAQRNGEIEMVLTGPQFAGKAWNPVARKQFEISEYSAWWRVVEPEVMKGAERTANADRQDR